MFDDEEELKNFLFIITSQKVFNGIDWSSTENAIRSAFCKEIAEMVKIGTYAGMFV